ncbi:MAG: hypothetical protein JEY94_01635 [Melioribacteraceae bacterium]|nr:hypothetical protein [Melioribacteraceae bacterium]
MTKKIYLIVLLMTCRLLSQNEETSDWFEFNPPVNYSDSRITMNNWLDAPAGKHGFLEMKNDELVFEDGEKIKFWGVNICSARPYTTHEEVDQWVKTLAAFGINGVRFHKFTSHGMPENISTNLLEDKYARLDYFHSRLKENGIYYGWSPIYGHKQRSGDKEKLLAYDEIKNADLKNHLTSSTIGLVNFAEDLQSLHIELIVNMLNHTNKYTGLKYADDPALAFVELQNEDNIFFSTAETMIDKCPTYKKLITERFSKWLLGKYQTIDKFKNVWGQLAFDWGVEVKNISWDLEKGNITPVANHGIYDYEYNKYQQKGETLPVFLLDMARFLYEEQMKFYKKFEIAIRETGYKGVLIGSCWQAGSGISHYYNLSADHILGMIDRHNYFGGGTGHTLRKGKMQNESMLSKPGSGLLSMGMQQVSDRPFSISEWLSLVPNEWISEGNSIIAAYGLGLQGWDASFSFASDYPWFTDKLHTPGVYNVMNPLQLSLYPAIARMVYRNDVKEGGIVSVRNVNIPSLATGNLGFWETIMQSYDVKDYNGIVPGEALAAGKVVVDFVDEYKETELPDISKFKNDIKKIITSNTNQLQWDYSGEGFFSVNTDGTQAVIGFAKDKKVQLSDLNITIKNNFANVLVSSLEKGKSIAESEALLITTIARARNSGMKFNSDKTEIIEVGNSPILIEPVIVDVELKKHHKAKLYVLDHMGQRTENVIEISNNKIRIDGVKFRTIYYELVYE